MQDSPPPRGANALVTARSGLVEGTMSQTGANTHDSDAEEASNVIEERLRLIIDTIPTIVWRKLPDGSADFLNRNFREYTGLSLEHGLGWGWMNAFHPDDRLKEEWRAALAAGKPFEKEARLRRADGQYRWFLIRAVPLRDEQGNIANWYGTTNDIDDRKRAEDRVRLIIDTLPMMVWTLRPNGVVDFVNQRWLDYTGLSLEEEIKEPTRVVHPEDLPRVIERWLADMAAGEPSEDEMRLRRADGEYRWFLVRTAPLRDEQGNVVKWYGVSIDIEDRKRAESQCRTLLDAIPQQIWSGPPDGTLDYCNARWRSSMGLGLKELQGEGWQSMLHPDDRERVLRAWHESVTDGTPYEQEERHRQADGEYRWFLSRGMPLRDADGRIVRWYGTNTDIEDLKRADGVIRKERDRAQRYLDIADVILLALDLEGRISLINRKGCSTLGWEEHELMGCDWVDFCLPPRIRDPLRTSFHSLIGGNLSYMENPVLTKSGEERMIGWRNTLLRDDRGQVIGTLSSGEDITDRKRAEDEVRRLSGQLLRLQDEERRRIARDLHDSTGQDLVALATTLSQLHASIPSSSRKLRKLASQCQALADRCIRDVRTLSYLLHPPMLDEAGLEDAIRHYAGGFTERTGIEVELEISPRLGRLKPHVELALFRVVQESLTNIQRHSGSPKGRIRVERDPGKFTVEISDKGSGISGGLPRRNGKMPFGLGVGIPSMHERVALIGGQLDIESSSSGTTVRVTIPADD
jgi:PAS domain S-box-containing protein